MYQAERQPILSKKAAGSRDAKLNSIARYTAQLQGQSGRDQPRRTGAAGQLSDLQKCRLVMKRRLFPSLFVFKNFKKLHHRSLDQVFCQLRTDYVERNMLKDVCTPEDVVYFGALILKVRLQSKILRSKQNKISADLILQHIDSAIPSCFIELQETSASRGRRPRHWAERIEEQFFQKKEFLDYSLEDAQEKFLSGLGLYNLMFSSYFVVQKGASAKREADQAHMMHQLAAQKYGRLGTMHSHSLGAHDADDLHSSEEDADNEAGEDSSSLEGYARKSPRRNQEIIEEASSREEGSSVRSEQLSDSDSGADRQRRLRPSRPRVRTSVRSARTEQPGERGAAGRQPGRPSSIWAKLADDELLLVINLQGLHILENSKRDRIAIHVDFEDILYVMGKGQRLKLGFVQQLGVLNTTQSSDCRTEFITDSLPGHKARAIAEDIVAYAQLRIAEMTKNDQVEFLHRNHVVTLFDKLGDQRAASQHSSLLSSQEEEVNRQEDLRNQEMGMFRTGSFKGLQELQINRADLLDSQDLDEEEEVMDGLGNGKMAAEKMKDLTCAERYSKTIQAQLGNCLKFRQDKFFAFSKRCPLYSATGLEASTLKSPARAPASHQATKPHQAGSEVAAESHREAGPAEESKEEPPAEEAAKGLQRRVAGSLSGGINFNLNLVDQPRIEEQQEETEEDSPLAEHKVEPSPHSENVAEPVVKEKEAAVPKETVPAWANFLSASQTTAAPIQKAPSPKPEPVAAPAEVRTPIQPKVEKLNNSSSAALKKDESGSNASGSKVDFKRLSTQELRDSAAQELFDQALMMAPSFDDD